MLSPSAFNALLKIMEEPPAYVKFILATTEIHKVPATIISRCQRYDFRRIRQEDLVTRLQFIAEQEKISLEPEAAELMARLSDGGMRDAISLLDRCAALGDVITAPMTAEAAGAAGRDHLLRMLEALHARDTAQTLRIVSELYDASKDPARLCEELILMLRDVMLLKASGDAGLTRCMASELPALQKLADESDMEQIMTNLNRLQTCRERMGRAVNRRVELEMTMIRMTAVTEAPVDNVNMQALYERVAQLESRPAAPAAAESPLTKPQSASVPEPEPEIDLHKVKMSDFQPVVQWQEILEECGRINPAVQGTLDGSTAVAYANVMLITAENPFFLTMFKVKENALSLGDAIQTVTGKRYAIRARCSRAAAAPNAVQGLLDKAKNSGIKTTSVT